MLTKQPSIYLEAGIQVLRSCTLHLESARRALRQGLLRLSVIPGIRKVRAGIHLRSSCVPKGILSIRDPRDPKAGDSLSALKLHTRFGALHCAATLTTDSRGTGSYAAFNTSDHSANRKPALQRASPHQGCCLDIRHEH